MTPYISRVENGHTIPSVRNLERWAAALGVKVYEVFADGEAKPQPPPLKLTQSRTTNPYEKSLLKAIKKMSGADRKLFLALLYDFARGRKPANRS